MIKMHMGEWIKQWKYARYHQSGCPNRARRGLLLEDQYADDDGPIYDDDDLGETKELVADSGASVML